MKRVLITGADGFLGQRLARSAGGFLPVLHVRREESWAHWRAQGVAETQRGDLAEARSLKEVPPVDVVVHLAGRSSGEPRDLYSSNVVTTATVVEWMARRGVPRLILASTGGVYAPGAGRPSREDDPLEPHSHYAVSKLSAELLVRRAVAEAGLQAIVLRFPHIFGPGNRKGVVWNFLESAATRGSVLLDGEGAQERDFLYVDDAVAALQGALTCASAGLLVLNIGTGRKYSLRELVALLAEALGRHPGHPDQRPRGTAAALHLA